MESGKGPGRRFGNFLSCASTSAIMHLFRSHGHSRASSVDSMPLAEWPANTSGSCHLFRHRKTSNELKDSSQRTRQAALRSLQEISTSATPHSGSSCVVNWTGNRTATRGCIVSLLKMKQREVISAVGFVAAHRFWAENHLFGWNDVCDASQSKPSKWQNLGPLGPGRTGSVSLPGRQQDHVLGRFGRWFHPHVTMDGWRRSCEARHVWFLPRHDPRLRLARGARKSCRTSWVVDAGRRACSRQQHLHRVSRRQVSRSGDNAMRREPVAGLLAGLEHSLLLFLGLCKSRSLEEEAFDHCRVARDCGRRRAEPQRRHHSCCHGQFSQAMWSLPRDGRLVFWVCAWALWVIFWIEWNRNEFSTSWYKKIDYTPTGFRVTKLF